MVEEITNKIDLKEALMKSIHECEYEIAQKKELKAIRKSGSWADATGTAKEKEDYVKAQVAGYDREIAELEADINLYYNQIIILNDKIELEYLKDE